jgi:hypothetical protein
MDIESKLQSWLEKEGQVMLSIQQKDKLKSLKKGRRTILLHKEKERRLKIIFVWLQDGDENTKFFHKFVN